MVDVLASIDWGSLYIPAPVALGAVAVIGYLFGRRTRSDQRTVRDAQRAKRELRRAKLVAKELEKIAELVRTDLATHRESVIRFKDRVSEMSHDTEDASWQELCREAESILRPTLKLAAQISYAYDQIRQQTNHLMAFTEVRTDPLTGVSNRRGLDETLEGMFALLERYDRPFSLAIFDLDHFKQINDQQGHLQGDRTLQKFARLADETVRDTDVVARYGGEEFVVMMPYTTLRGGAILAERLRKLVAERLPITISCGIAEAVVGDTSQSLLSRADSALYSAKAAGRNRSFLHDGESIEMVEADESATIPRATLSAGAE